MKKYLLAFAISSLAISSYAGVDFPTNFEKIFDSSKSISENISGWTVYAPDGIPAGFCTFYFPYYSPTNAVRVINGTVPDLWSVCEYGNGSKSDTWIITPEIEVLYDEETLVFMVEGIGFPSSVSNNFAVYISEGGVQKSDFKLFKEGSLTGKGNESVASTSRRYGLSGYKGKKIRLAFVNSGNTQGMIGFGDIKLGSWTASDYPAPASFSNIMMNPGDNLDFNMKVVVPVRCDGFTIDFKTEGGFSYSLNKTDQTLRNLMQSTVEIVIPKITLNSDFEKYTLTFTPNFEGAGTATFSGLIINNTLVKREFNAVGVMEEGTGTWCGWCPYGAAALDYYSDTLTGENGTNKAIAIAVHDYDPMEINPSISDYYNQFMSQNNVTGLPAVVINRLYGVTPSTNPKVVGDALTNVFNTKSYAKAELTGVYYQPSVERKVWAKFNLNTSFDHPEGLLAVSAIVTEDNVQGNNEDYIQVSYLSGVTATSIRMQLGAAWVPYFEPYYGLQYNTQGVGYVDYPDIQYQHVARAAFPSYSGVLLPAFNASETFMGEVVFDMPDNVLIKENTNVIILVRNFSTGEIVAADEVSFDNFKFESGVENVMAEGNIVSTSYYSLDGRRINNPDKGIFIRVDTYSNGKNVTTKIVK